MASRALCAFFSRLCRCSTLIAFSLGVGGSVSGAVSSSSGQIPSKSAIRGVPGAGEDKLEEEFYLSFSCCANSVSAFAASIPSRAGPFPWASSSRRNPSSKTPSTPGETFDEVGWVS